MGQGNRVKQVGSNNINAVFDLNVISRLIDKNETNKVKMGS